MQKILSLFIAVLFITTSFAQETAVAEATKIYAPTGEENSLLWEISGNELATSSYLFGTIHMIGKDDYFFTKVMEEAFAKSDQVFFEIDTESMFDMTTQLSLLMKSFMKGGKRLRDLISKEDYKLVEDHFEDIGLPLAFLERVKPMILSMFAAEGMTEGEGMGISMNEIKSYEMELTDKAKAAKKPIDGLETIQYQMSMFDSIPYEAQAKMLVDGIKNGGSTEEADFGAMVELYKNQDLLGLHELINSNEEDVLSKYNNVLLGNRNRNWIVPMKKEMAKASSFFAVGAGHLSGEDGVIALLRKEGFTVVPMK